MSVPKVLVVGAGGVGTITALSLYLNKKSDVTLVVRSDYEQVVKEGYEIDSATYGHITHWRPHHVSKSVDAAFKDHGEFDYIVVTTKNIPDSAHTCEDIIKPAVTLGKTVIILVQNGIEIEKPMHEEFPDNIILSGVQHIGSFNINCKITNSHKDQLFLGVFEHDNHPNHKEYMEKAKAKVEEFRDIYQNDDHNVNKVTIEHNVKETRWQKLLYNSAINTVTALVGLDVTRCQIAGANDTLFRPAMDEIIKIAASDGVVIDESYREKFIHIGDGLFYSPSMALDHKKGQLMELEIILGNPLKVARRNNVSTPVLDVLHKLLTLTQFKLREERGLFVINEDDYPRGSDSDKYGEVFKASQKKA